MGSITRFISPETASIVLAREATSLAWKDSFHLEWLDFHSNITQSRRPKTSLTDAREDLTLFQDMIACMRVAT